MVSEDRFSERDEAQIASKGLSIGQVMEQIQAFREGAVPLKLNRPCTVHDGIHIVGEEEGIMLSGIHDEEAAAGRMLKFVPASGAASRMFKDWFQMMDIENKNDAGRKIRFLEDLRKYAFFEDLKTEADKRGHNLDALMKEGNAQLILSLILNPEGMNYGRLPKALLKFHGYPEGARTAIEEHLAEAALYVKDQAGRCRLHFTVSTEHLKLVDAFLKSRIGDYEKRFEGSFDLSLSVQHASTDTVAVDLNGEPFRDDNGLLVFRPGGHGALLENLGQLNGDIIFIKNIDNVVPDHLKPLTVLYKKILGGYLIRLQRTIFSSIKRLIGGAVQERDLAEIMAFCERDLHISFPSQFHVQSQAERCEELFRKLNRPLRVCGVVKNVGEPGGGPFWVEDEKGGCSLQIVEEIQIDGSSDRQRSLWKNATHFNPVDLVCGVRDYLFRNFDLKCFVNSKAISIARKTEKGRELQALELPGLWNGAMADWNTVLIEVPLETFNPVKTVEDLLRPQHQ